MGGHPAAASHDAGTIKAGFVFRFRDAAGDSLRAHGACHPTRMVAQ